MKAKLFVIILTIFIFLPAAFLLIREYNLRKVAPKPVLKTVVRDDPRVPYNYKVNICDSNEKGYLLMSPYMLFIWKYGELIITDMQGRMVYHKLTNASIYSFRQWDIHGKTYYSYIINDTTVHHIWDISLTAGHVVILDSMMNEIKQVHLLPHDKIVIDNRQDLDLHDFIMFDEDHFMTMAAYEKNVRNIPDSLKPSPRIKVAAPVFQEIQGGKVIWQWDATDYPELYASSRLHNKFGDTTITQDYLHINSFSVDPKDNNVIVSFRNTDQIIKISKKTGEIMWRLGGNKSDFPITKEQEFLRQHDAKFIDKYTMMLLDNGDSGLRQYSRVLEFKLDEKNHKILDFKQFKIDEPFAAYMGYVEKRGDNYFIAGGSGNYVTEVNYKTGKKSFELQGNLSSYRAYRVASLHGLEKLGIK